MLATLVAGRALDVRSLVDSVFPPPTALDSRVVWNETGAGGLDVLEEFEEAFEMIADLDSSANSGLR